MGIICIRICEVYKTHRQHLLFQIQVDRVHHDKHLMVLVDEAVRFAQRRLAKVLDPSVAPEERRRQPQRQTQLERETVDARRQHHRRGSGGGATARGAAATAGAVVVTVVQIVAEQLHAKVDKVLAVVVALLARRGGPCAHHALADHVKVEAERRRVLLQLEQHAARQKLAGKVQQRRVVEEDEEFEQFARHDANFYF